MQVQVAVLFRERCGDKVSVSVPLKQGQICREGVGEREREIGALCFHLANECTLTSLGKTVTGCLHKVRWKWSYFLPFFVERVGSGDMTKLRGI